MSLVTKKIWTQTLVNGTIVIDSNYGLSEISVLLLNGTGDLLGNALVNGLPSVSFPLVIGVGVSISTGSNSLLDSITITTTGTVALMGR
jgi:hypothetical protein